MSEVIAEVADVPSDHVAVLSGPNLAREIAAGEPTATVIACRDHDRAVALQHACLTGYFRSYTNTDVIGCELGGAGKNVIALAVGMAAGMGLGDNSRASLITRGLAEISRLGVALGADPLTFAGLAGLGDLVATCSSPLSRNRTFGERLGRGETLAEAEAANHGQVAEGVKSCLSICQLGGAPRRRAADLRRGAAGVPRRPPGRVAGQGADQPDAPARVGGATAAYAARWRSATGRAACTAGHTADGSPGRRCTPARCCPRRSTSDRPTTRSPPDFYGRPGNPTWTALEEAVGALDGGECVSFASGMAAIGAVLRLTARAGRAIVLPSDGYYVTRALAQTELAPLGVEVREVPTPGPWPERVLDGATLLLVETPSNPGLDVCDIRAAAAAAHAAGALLAVDNTTATPLGQRPLALGADLTVASDTKALAGHGDVLLGHVTAADPALAAAPARGPHPQRRCPRPDGGLARPPRSGHARPAPGPPGRQRRGGGPRRAGPPRRQRRPVARSARRPVAPVAAAQMRRWNGVLRFTLPSPRP